MIAIIIVNWNKKNYILNLLSNLKDIPESADIIVVDNASTDDSVSAIKKNHPIVTLIENEKNTGGSGGFNTGMKWGLENDYEYLWLLDNDANINMETLTGLVDVLNKNPHIGVVGSTICYPENHGYVVEQGGMVDWNSGIWKACHMNSKFSDLSVTNNDVDYVAACSMLIRSNILKKTDLFDKKLFIHWDDIDFCLRCKKHGYSVVSTKNSIVYHHGENDCPPDFIYYNFRNSLIIMSTHLNGLEKIFAIYNQLRRILKGKYLSHLLQDKTAYNIFTNSIKDFNSEQFYKIPQSININDNAHNSDECVDINECKNFLILPYGSIQDIENCISFIKSKSSMNIVTILIQKERARFLSNKSDIDNIIYFLGERGSLKNNIKNLLRIFISNYDMGVVATKHLRIPFYTFFLKKNIIYNPDLKKINSLKYNRLDILKLIPAFLLGELAAIFLLPKTLKTAKKIKNS